MYVPSLANQGTIEFVKMQDSISDEEDPMQAKLKIKSTFRASQVVERKEDKEGVQTMRSDG